MTSNLFFVSAIIPVFNGERSSVFDTVGRFDETQRYCDDWDWFMQARECGVSILVRRDVTQGLRRTSGTLIITGRSRFSTESIRFNREVTIS